MASKLNDAFNLALKADPSNAGAERAQAIIDEVVAEVPDSTDTWMMLARFHLWESKQAEAIAAYSEVISRRPFHRDALLYRAMTWTEMKKYDLAREGFQAALNLEPLDWNTRFELGHAEQQLGEWQRAISHFDEAAKVAERVKEDKPQTGIHFNYSYLLRNRGWCRASLGQWDQAAEDYRRAAELSPDKLNFRLELSLLHYQRGDFAKASELCQQMLAALSDESSAADVDRILWHCVQRPGFISDLPRARQLVERIAKADPENWAYHETLGWIEHRAGNLASAIKSFDEVVKLHPDEGTLWTWSGLAIAHRKAGNQAKAQSFKRRFDDAGNMALEAGAAGVTNWMLTLKQQQQLVELKTAFTP